MKSSLTTVGLFLVAVLSIAACKPATVETPCPDCNILLVSMDTLRADHLGVYGYPRPTSPNIDLLARESIVFERAFSQSAWTRPVHASMFTGLYPVEHGIVGMTRGGAMPESIPTLATILSAAGYRTAAFTGGGNMAAHFGFDSGFESYRSPGRRFEDHLSAIERWLERDDKRPWLLFVHGYDAHRPYKSSSSDRQALGLPAATPKGILSACKTSTDPSSVAPLVDEYDAGIRRGDRSLGRLLELVAEHADADKTIIVFTSDHGEEFLEHGRCFHIRTLYREVLHVPLVMKVPGFKPRRVQQVVPASTSITPTLLGLVGRRAPQQPGPSLVVALRGGRADTGEVISETSSRNVDAMGTSQGHGHVRALVTDDEKLIHWIEQARYEYYDIRRDPMEKRPEKSSPRIDVLAGRMQRWLDQHPPLDLQTCDVIVPLRLQKQLRRMGYIE